MASGGSGHRAAMSEPRRRPRSAFKVRPSNLADTVSEDRSSVRSGPSLQEDRPNNWDFSDWRPSSMFDSSKRIKKENPEKERDKEKEKGQSLLQESPGAPGRSDRIKHRTPSTFPRTKITATTPATQRVALEKLKTQLNFSDGDEFSTDGERNNERRVPSRRDFQPTNYTHQSKRERPANYTPQDSVRVVPETRHDNRPLREERVDNRSVNIGEGEPDSNHIVGRLMQIRGYIKQATAMKEQLQAASGESMVLNKADKVNQVIDQLKEQEKNYMDFLLKISRAKKEQLMKVNGLLEHLKEQESGYMTLLEKMLSTDSELEEAAAAAMDTTPKDDEEDTESVDLGVDAQSEVSESTTNLTLNAYTRPKIEDHLGTYSDEEPPCSVISEERSTLALDHEGSNAALDDYLEQKKKEMDEMETEQKSHWDVLTLEARAAIQEKNDELNGLRQQRDLLRKMLDQQKHLRDLQGRQVALLQMQKNAECDIEDINTETDTGDEGPIAAAAAANAVGSDQDKSDESPTSLDIVPKELKELRQKLDYLKNIYQNYPKRDQPDVRNQSTEEKQETSESEASTISTNTKTQMLQNKLEDLREKKASMDDLLAELQTMREQRYTQITNDLDSTKDSEAASVSSSQIKIDQHQAATDIAGATISDANDVLEMLDARSKLKKLEEVRSRLGHLKDLVQYYETGNQFIHEPVDGEDQSSLPAFSDYEDPELMRNLKAFKDDQEFARKLYQRQRKLEEAAGASGGVEEMDQDDSQQQTEQDSDTETQSQVSLGPWGEDPEIQQKVRKLKDAKDRLRRLQQLVNAVQQGPQDILPDELAELVASVDDNETSPTEQSEDKMVDTSYMVSEGEVPMSMTEREYETRMGQQRGELNQLLQERTRLLGIQDQLQKLHDQLPGMEYPAKKTMLNSNGSSNGGRVKQPVTFQEPPEVVTNDELYDKMRCQRILREELRQKKREMEAIMRKGRLKKQYNKNQDNQSDNVSYSNRSDPFGTMSGDFTTAATWGGSTTENLEETEEKNAKKQNDDHTDSSTTTEDDDAYPSDGIVQVEEEEEEDDQSDCETYTIEDEDEKPGPCVRPTIIDSGGARSKMKKGKTSRDSLDNRQPRFNAWGSGTSLPKGASKGPTPKGRGKPVAKGKKERPVRQENYRSPEDIVREAGRGEIPNALQRQLETTTALCQSLLRDQQALNQMLQGGIGTPGVMTAGSQYRPPYFAADPMSQLTQQQLQLTLQNCQQQMYQQHIDMMHLQQQMTALMLDTSRTREPEEDFRNPYAGHSLHNPFRLPNPSPFPSPLPQPQMFPQPSPGFSFSPVFPSGFALGTDPGRYQAPPSQEGGREIWNKTTGDRKKVQSKGTDTGDEFKRYPVKPTIPDEDVPKLNLEEILNSKKKSKKPLKVDVKKREEKDSAVIGRKFPSGPSGGRATAMAKLSSKKRPTSAVTKDVLRPGLSSNICGTAFQDYASQSSAASSIPAEQMSLAKLLEKRAEGKKIEDFDSDDLSNLSLFEVLRETIYSEVATLISQNEDRPHFLVEIFRELQMLGSDYLRQRALYSIQDLVTRFLTDDGLEPDSTGIEAPRPLWLNATGHTASEQTPSESLLTSEDEHENPAQEFLKMNGILPNTKDEPSQSTESRERVQYDYGENVDNVSTLSTPNSTQGWENPFARDSLGDTVIHLDKAMKRMREYERKLALAEGKDPDGASPQTKSVEKEAPEVVSSSAMDQGSESSASEVHYPRINTQQLDSQIKHIMTEVIPIMKEHMDTVCSPQLLGYIKQIVLNLAKQDDEGKEFVRFFYKQLGTLLQDSLAKFEGRKLSECGEELLVDVSEVLFNELAFFCLMQNLDDPALSTQRMLSKFRQDSMTSGTEMSTQDGHEGDSHIEDESEIRLEYETTEKSDSGDDSDDEAENIEDATKATVNEEEELGKVRDDELAGAVDVNERDDDSETNPNSSMMKVELAMSETKPFNRIGSDEDDEYASDESHQSAADPSETAVSREVQEDEEQPAQDKGDEEEKDVDEVEAESKTQMNGEVGNEDDDVDDEDDDDELEVDDLPKKLNVNQSLIDEKMVEEDLANSAAAAALSITENELAGDPMQLKEPELLNNTTDA